MPNLTAAIPGRMQEELTEILLATDGVQIERIVSRGQASPEGFWYDQDQNEWVLVAQGRARLRLEDEVVELVAGDYVHIPAHRKHRVDWTAPDETTIWLVVFYG